MEPKILDGKMLASEIKESIKSKTKTMSKPPKIIIFQVGDNPASNTYIKNKIKDCEEVGITAELCKFDESITESSLKSEIQRLSNNRDCTGAIVQLPLPAHINESEVIKYISSGKDIDGQTIQNLGLLVEGSQKVIPPCTPHGIMRLLERYNISVEGQVCVIVGRSNIVGKPLAMMMINAGATVISCNSKTKDLASMCKQADILVSAVGKQDFITADMVKPGAVLIDVGINRNSEGKLCGDMTKEAYTKSSYYTPVPGGVGPMTRAILLENIIKCTR